MGQAGERVLVHHRRSSCSKEDKPGKGFVSKDAVVKGTQVLVGSK